MCPRYWYDANKEVHSATHLSQAVRRKQEGSNRTAHQGTERDDLSNSVNTVIPQFRHHVENEEQPLEKREGQQQVLRATFPGIRNCVRGTSGCANGCTSAEISRDSSHGREG